MDRQAYQVRLDIPSYKLSCARFGESRDPFRANRIAPNQERGLSPAPSAMSVQIVPALELHREQKTPDIPLGLQEQLSTIWIRSYLRGAKSHSHGSLAQVGLYSLQLRVPRMIVLADGVLSTAHLWR